MKRSLWLMMLALLLALALVACGGGGGEAPAEGGDTGGEDTAAQPEEPTAVPAEELECTDEIGCVEVGPDEPINIAYMLTTSGATAFLGEDSVGGIEIAIDDRGGELLGHEIEVSGEDSLCSAEGGQTAAQKVAANESILGAIGTNCSSAGAAALPIISQAGMVMISPSNTAPTLTNDDAAAGGTWQPGYYRTAHNDLFQGRVAAEFAFNELGAASVATIHDGSPYAEGLQAVFAQTILDLGGEVTFQGAVNVGDTDMRPILTEIASNPPDVLYFPIFEPEGPLIVAQISDVAGLEETILMGADGLLVDSFPENAGSNAEGMYLSGPFIEGGTYDEFLAKWDAKFGGTPPSGFHAHAYDATNMLLDAIEASAKVNDDGTLLIGRQGIRDALNAIAGFPGLTGTLTCGPTGDCATGEALGIYQITDAEITGGNWPPAVVWTPSGGSADAAAGGDETAAADEAFECTDDLGCVEVAPDEPINIAYMLTTSGATAFLGEDSVGGIEIAIDDRGGELLGHEIEVSGEDSLCSAEGGQTAAQKVAANESILGAIGTNCSSAGAAALPIISQAGMVMISPSNTAPTLTNDDAAAGGTWQPGYYRTAHNDLFQGRVAAEFAFNELGAASVATIHDGSPYAEGLQAVFAQTILDLGGEVTFQGAVNVGDTDMRPILTEIASNPPDVLYFPIFEPEGPLIVAQISDVAGLEETILMGADGLLVDSFPENAGSNAEGMYLSGPFIEGGTYDEFLAKWDAKFGGTPPSGFHAHAYDATNMLLDAIEASAKVNDDGTLLIGRQGIRDALNAIAGFPGLTGTLTCGPTGDCATGEALGIYLITDAEITGGNWPPAVAWTP